MDEEENFQGKRCLLGSLETRTLFLGKRLEQEQYTLC